MTDRGRLTPAAPLAFDISNFSLSLSCNNRVILSERSESKDLRTDLTENVVASA